MKKILLVEDNEMNKDMLSRRLSKKGYEVVFAMDGQQAIDNAIIEKPDVILMDMGLPVKDGLQATREIKASVETKSIPIIALFNRSKSLTSPRKNLKRGYFDLGYISWSSDCLSSSLL